MSAEQGESSASQSSRWEPSYKHKGEASPFTCEDLAFTETISSACLYERDIFLRVIENLVKNPNLTSSHLFRADIYYDSSNDVSFDPECTFGYVSDFIKHMKAELQPRHLKILNHTLKRTVVRQLVPRNPRLDRPLVQTCHFFEGYNEDGAPRELVVYLPHVDKAEEMPWYHPPVKALAFLYQTFEQRDTTSEPIESSANNELSLHISRFSRDKEKGSNKQSRDTSDRDSETNAKEIRLERTLLQLLRVINKHGTGQQKGYQKRVHHDLIVPQARFQDTYTRLKMKYAKELVSGWQEQTDPRKHVFEDLGIAAFLIELWTDMYDFEGKKHGSIGIDNQDNRDASSTDTFSGFVDIGCGNGILVHVLRQEGYDGWGFDARARKTWQALPEDTTAHLKELLLIPKLYQEHSVTTEMNPKQLAIHDGCFHPGTFIISNHADELTAWTPLLAYLSSSPFICIPCCSHSLSGVRFRAPKRRSKPTLNDLTKSKEQEQSIENCDKSGSLAKSNGQGKTQSAYASLCGYITSLTEDLDFDLEKEMLRIPSTRNFAVVGRKGKALERASLANETRVLKVRNTIEVELKQSIMTSSTDWITRAILLTTSSKIDLH